MLQNLALRLTPALMDRLMLLVNHVLASEAEATRRLSAHVGRLIRIEVGNWPALLPPLPVLDFRVTAAGLLEWVADEADAEADLRVSFDAANPAELAWRAALGERPPIEVVGAADLAADLDWLIRNLRWDIGADLERLFGPLVAAQLQSVGSMFASGFKAARSGLSRVAQRSSAAAR
jgi:ubiquinone biosynthesis protein UbiJ